MLRTTIAGSDQPPWGGSGWEALGEGLAWPIRWVAQKCVPGAFGVVFRPTMVATQGGRCSNPSELKPIKPIKPINPIQPSRREVLSRGSPTHSIARTDGRACPALAGWRHRRTAAHGTGSSGGHGCVPAAIHDRASVQVPDFARASGGRRHFIWKPMSTFLGPQIPAPTPAPCAVADAEA